MSAPSSPSEVHSQGSYNASSQQATGVATVDTATSGQKSVVAFGSFMSGTCSVPNSAFTQRSALARSHSVSSELRRSLSPLGMLVAQCRAHCAEQKAESAMSRVGRVADEVREARMVAAASNAEAESTKETLHTQTASFTVQEEASVGRVAEMMEGRV